MSNSARCYVEISRSRLAANYAAVCEAVGPKIAVAGVVKAEAYGHGMLEVSRVLIQQGAQWLAVSTVAEGIALREAGIGARVLVMAGLLPQDRAPAIAFNLTPVAHSIDDIRGFEEAAAAASRVLPFHLKLDTGMARLGTRSSPAEIVQALDGLQFARLEGLMSHFASASDFTTPQTDRQISCFGDLCRKLSTRGVTPRFLHLSSTNALAYARPDAWQGMVRPGHAIYGYVSPAKGIAPKPAFQVQPALTWKVKIVAVKDVPANTLVGYGGTACTRRATRLAILGAGYADGIPHRLSNRGSVIAGGRLVPILGTVSMDLTTIDITEVPWLRVGEDVTILGRDGAAEQWAQEIARVAGTISYNVLCGIKPRVQRIYVD